MLVCLPNIIILKTVYFIGKNLFVGGCRWWYAEAQRLHQIFATKNLYPMCLQKSSPFPCWYLYLLLVLFIICVLLGHDFVYVLGECVSFDITTKRSKLTMGGVATATKWRRDARNEVFRSLQGSFCFGHLTTMTSTIWRLFSDH